MKVIAKILVSSAVTAFCAMSAYAGIFLHTQEHAGVYINNNVSIPAAATCSQWGIPSGSGSYVSNGGPLGYYQACYPDSFSVGQVPISAGTYSVQQIVNGSGITQTVITW